MYATLRTLSMANRWRKSIVGRRESVFTNFSGQGRIGATSFVKVENTYKTESDEDKMFKSSQVEEVIFDILKNSLKDATYDPVHTQDLTKNLTILIRKAIKRFEFPRYKIVCHVMLGEYKGQGMQTSSRFLWDEKHDNYACANYHNDAIFGVATVYGIYFD